MAFKDRPTPVNQSVELGSLMSSAIASVVQAQEQLDAYTEQRRQAFASAEPGELVLPPLWFTFSDVELEMELAATVGRVPGREGAHILSRTLNPTSVGLFGYAASSGLRVRVRMAPRGFVPVKAAAAEDAAGEAGEPPATDAQDG